MVGGAVIIPVGRSFHAAPLKTLGNLPSFCSKLSMVVHVYFYTHHQR
jgi:hypothetical protein